ncbi:MAG: phosphoglycerate dehydrogenase [Flavobacteriales bacterium]|nr:phosphoglycerate dehydrogenase [Flavobacteriales bacterium]
MRNRCNILIVDRMHPALMGILDELNVDYSYMPEISKAEIQKIISNFDALIVRSKIECNTVFLNQNKHLRLVARAGSGMDNIDLEEAERLNIDCINCPEANCDAVGEQTVGMLLTLAHNIVKGNNEIGQFVWDREGNRGFEIGYQTIGIIGYGHTGSAVARKLSGFGCKVLAYDKYKSGFGGKLVQEVTLNQLLEEADVISFHVPLTNETRAWINQDFISSVHKSFGLLNLCRGEIMVTNDILTALETGKIRFFGADVLENENFDKLNDSQKNILTRLIERSNVVLTPHVGGWTAESFEKISVVLGKKIRNWLNKQDKVKNQRATQKNFVG